MLCLINGVMMLERFNTLLRQTGFGQNSQDYLKVLIQQVICSSKTLSLVVVVLHVVKCLLLKIRQEEGILQLVCV